MAGKLCGGLLSVALTARDGSAQLGGAFGDGLFDAVAGCGEVESQIFEGHVVVAHCDLVWGSGLPIWYSATCGSTIGIERNPVARIRVLVVILAKRSSICPTAPSARAEERSNGRS